jgi:hypothetical protein
VLTAVKHGQTPRISVGEIYQYSEDYDIFDYVDWKPHKSYIAKRSKGMIEMRVTSQPDEEEQGDEV